MGALPLLAAILTVCAVPDLGADDDAASFEKDLAQAQVLIEKQRWKKAKDLILDAVGEHEERPYVRKRLASLKEDLKRCTFTSKARIAICKSCASALLRTTRSIEARSSRIRAELVESTWPRSAWST